MDSLAKVASTVYEENRKCPCCNGAASLGICTGLATGRPSINKCTCGRQRPFGPFLRLPNFFPWLATQLSPEKGATKLAAHPGPTATGFELIPPEKYADADELRELWSELVPGEFEDHSHPIACAFCAKFLPSLVSAHKAAPTAHGPYHCMLIGVSQSLYFAKFMRSPLGSDLWSCYLNENGPSGDHIAPTVGLLILSTSHAATNLLDQMFMDTSPTCSLSQKVSAQLEDWLRESAARSLETLRPKPGTSCRCQECLNLESQRALSNVLTILNILDGRLKSEALRLSLTRRETFDRYAAQHGAKMMTRFECPRCQTVAYCCKAHQKTDWRGHKRQCFETAYRLFVLSIEQASLASKDSVMEQRVPHLWSMRSGIHHNLLNHRYTCTSRIMQRKVRNWCFISGTRSFDSRC
ncbi:hypothetical protein B0H13DRAFT_2288924 [Mycena leptocephala]|nr:hypothetical protein B0H13DRAFT_2288924 [Mycena leptocephala]